MVIWLLETWTGRDESHGSGFQSPTIKGGCCDPLLFLARSTVLVEALSDELSAKRQRSKVSAEKARETLETMIANPLTKGRSHTDAAIPQRRKPRRRRRIQKLFARCHCFAHHETLVL